METLERLYGKFLARLLVWSVCIGGIAWGIGQIEILFGLCK
jgi:hypothetical protein